MFKGKIMDLELLAKGSRLQSRAWEYNNILQNLWIAGKITAFQLDKMKAGEFVTREQSTFLNNLCYTYNYKPNRYLEDKDKMDLIKQIESRVKNSSNIEENKSTLDDDLNVIAFDFSDVITSRICCKLQILNRHLNFMTSLCEVKKAQDIVNIAGHGIEKYAQEELGSKVGIVGEKVEETFIKGLSKLLIYGTSEDYKRVYDFLKHEFNYFFNRNSELSQRLKMDQECKKALRCLKNESGTFYSQESIYAIKGTLWGRFKDIYGLV